MKTLQEHYNAIKDGKGNKSQFLKHARSLFPEYFNQYTDFNTATRVLKSKQIISEAAGGVVSKGFDIWDWKKILAEETKSVEKETSKEVLDAQANTYDNKDMKNADNVNFNEIMKGFYCELKDEKNKDKTGDELKAMVVKNLAKDPLYYTKNGEFGTKGVGYTTEAPGLGEPKEPKGKYKSSGYGDLNTDKKVEKVKANVQDSLGDKEAKTSDPKKVKEMPVTPQNSAGVKKMRRPGSEKTMKLQENKETNDEKIERYEKYTYILNGKEVKPDEIAFYDHLLGAEIDGKLYKLGIPKNGKVELREIEQSLNEQKLRSLIHNIIKEELEEVFIGENKYNEYKKMPDYELIQWAKDDGGEDMIVMDGEGGLANREEIIKYLLGTEVDGDFDYDTRKDEIEWDKDDLDPAGGRGLSSHLEEQKLRSSIQQIIKEELDEASINPEGELEGFNSNEKISLDKFKKDILEALESMNIPLPQSIIKQNNEAIEEYYKILMDEDQRYDFTPEEFKIHADTLAQSLIIKAGGVENFPGLNEDKGIDYAPPLKAVKIADKIIAWYENHPNSKMQELVNSIERNIENMLSKTIGKNAISVEEFEKIVRSKYGKPFKDPNYSVFKNATLNGYGEDSDLFKEGMDWGKYTIQVLDGDYKGTIKRSKEGWMMYDENNQPEEAGPFKTLDSLMSYYDLTKDNLIGDYIKNLR